MQPLISHTTGFLYKNVLKPIFFCFNPESVHNTLVFCGSRGSRWPIFRRVMALSWAYAGKTSRRRIDGIKFPNPVGLSAGFDYNGELVDALPAMGFGFHTIGTVTLESYAGNQPPRLVRLPRSRALIVNKGLKNVGAKRVIQNLEGATFSIPVGISIASTNRKYKTELEQIQDILGCFRLFEASSVRHSYYELNISCPNTYGGEPFTTPEKLHTLLRHIDNLKLTRPVYAKMPIDQSEHETKKLLRVLNKHTVHGVIFGNLTKDKLNPDVSVEDVKIWKIHKGNVSGFPTRSRSNACIRLTKKEYGSRFTIIGTGGIFSGKDAQEKMEQGADLVQLITGMIYEGPQLIGQINQYLDYSKRR